VKTLVKEGAVGILKSFVAAVHFVSPLINELAEDSRYLKDLLRETKRSINKGNTYMIAKSVVIAERDRIVSNQQFAHDPPPITLAGTTHTLVCKPKITFLDPFVVMRGVL
jgi:hypothetical protein